MKKITLFGLSLAGLALLALPQTGQAFELKEVWPIKGGIIYENGKVARFNNGHEVDIQVLDLPKTEKIEWTISLNGQDQTTNFLGEEKEKSMVGEEGRYLNFYVPYGYSGDIKVEAKSGDEVKTWSTKVMDDIYHGGKSSYYRLEEEKDQYTYLDTKWDYKTKTYTATLPDTSKGKKVVAWRGSQYDSVKLEKPGEITRPYSGTSLLSFYPIFETAGWFKSDSIWYYQKQGELVKNDWLKYQGYWYFMDGAGGMIHGGWICSEDIWYYFKDSGIMMSNEWKFYNNRWYYLKSSGAMASNEWIYDQGNWYFVKSSGAMASQEWVYIQGKWYYFESSGVMKKSTWFFYRGDWYYLTDSGALLRDDWFYYGDTWYYLKGSGVMASNEWIQVQGKWYYLDSSGKMLRNTYTPDGYYVGSSGAWQ
ncbi:endo-beta-N-acetylglucosaminidase domain protein [Streptococcus sp. oral taxon 071 str. 73H25AP]|uniref:Endo-beta-N-acetylglucosaminidase domain protein n=1 Tax=Streptococcus oralis SK304 TaxID=1161421 RepID=J4UE86_STROR|nr:MULTISPECIES: N-acetylmuramoyl-L-alanine amidase family protein [Streptococcus]EFM36178.1 endo-beta-N-acetylglucosaminidase domain protein [Streptococcus sp. oral taxon 071 str. 73H25AP]EJP21677.1 endo-beta-N-acetylglucosaminidase domain protein [Streptococcus oralis SK304]MCY7077318.1 N-acetylmuramoyl-L-alanine amidase family protein [Streptococcus oralis]